MTRAPWSVCLRPAVALLVGVALAVVQGSRPSRGQSVTIVRDLAYRAGEGAVGDRHRLDLYLPPGQGWPLAVLVHGGDWRSGARFTTAGGRYDNVARALADRGIAVALVDHRLTDGGPSSTVHPGHVEDVAAALAFARSWLVARGTRAGETFLVGHESGAHLAALLATNPRFLRAEGLSPNAVRGVIGLSGTYRIDPLSAEDADVFGRDPEMRLDASPYHQVSAQAHAPSARFLLIVASAERPGLEDDARAFRQRIVAVGGDAELDTLPRDHDALVDRIGLPGDVTTDRLVEAILAGRAATATATPTPSIVPSATATTWPTATATAADARPPEAPPNGPGSALRPHDPTRTLVGGTGDSGWQAWWPAGDGGMPWPVIVFFPDAGRGRSAGDYAGWLDHLAAGGAVVIAPAGAAGGVGDPSIQAGKVVERAVDELLAAGVLADRDWRAYVGHGTGADIATRLAAGWYQHGLPAPRALMAIGPRLAGEAVGLARAGRLPGDAMAVLVTLSADDRDRLAEDRVWRAVRALPGRQRALLELHTDGHGRPALVADGRAPLTDGDAGRSDALDWRGTWRWLDALVACRRDGRWCAHVLEDPVVQVDLGRWSDGWPVVAARVGGGVPPAPWVALPIGLR